MSTLLEMLNKRDRQKDGKGYALHEEIVNTYFKTSNNKSNKKNVLSMIKMPWVVASIAIILTIVVLISKSNIDIKIRVLSQIPSVTKEGVGIFFVSGGVPNRYMVKNAFFSGDARTFSSQTDTELVLCNSKGEGWANYTIQLRESVDFSRLDLRYSARGMKGDEHIVLIVVDADNRTYRMEKDIASTVTKEWQEYVINFNPIKKAVDLANIVDMRFEFGSLTVGNNATTTIYLKDIYVSKTKRIKWL